MIQEDLQQKRFAVQVLTELDAAVREARSTGRNSKSGEVDRTMC